MRPDDDTYGRSELSGKSLDQARAMYENAYNGDDFKVELTDQTFAYRYTAAGNADMTLRSSTFLGTVEGSIQPQGEYVAMWMTEGHGTVDVGGSDTEAELGRPAMFPTGKLFAFEMNEFKQNLVHFRAGYLEQIAAEHEGALAGPLTFDHTARLDDATLASWKQTITTVAKTVLTPVAPSVLMQAEVTRLAAVALLDTFPHEVIGYDSVLLAPRNARLRSAVEYIHAQARLPLTATDIAAQAGLSPRGLQQAFSTQLGSTPMNYLRRVRLDYVRAELQNLHPDHVTVAEVAQRWGFIHLGRFSAAYVDKFGEYPSDTLRS
ncbi:helix-turn-helix transcriptional regulator [Frigoribacterium sp. 2-23]|uniref:helix-turn-helix transcriptional regulator n=1 Tax=Frigoribacterium sp. 2-23 TaxID=3415006 RepID=UPI003C6F1321